MIRTILELERRWNWAWQTLNLRGDQTVWFESVISGYYEPHRRYHVPEHLLTGLEDLDLYLQENPDVLKPWEVALLILAFFWHDETWGTTVDDKSNVAESARGALIMGEQTGVSRGGRRLLKGMVQVTDHKTAPTNLLERLIICLDLVILGKEWPMYRLYARFVRQEYPQYTDAQWCTGRPNFMKVLAAHQLYPVPYSRAKYEAQAKENIRREIELLRSGTQL